MTEAFQRNLIAAAERAYASGRFRYTDFLSLSERQEFEAISASLAYAGVKAFGGYEGAERVVLRFGEGAEEPFPIACVKISPRGAKFAAPLTHRDVLGSILSLGIERSVIGDLLVEADAAVVFCLSRMEEELLRLDRVGRTPVRAERFVGEIAPMIRTERIRIAVASPRADCVVAGVYGLSRAEAESAFAAGRVLCNGRIAEASDRLASGDTVSVRGKGKFRFLGEEGKSRKDRTFIAAERYL